MPILRRHSESTPAGSESLSVNAFPNSFPITGPRPVFFLSFSHITRSTGEIFRSICGFPINCPCQKKAELRVSFTFFLAVLTALLSACETEILEPQDNRLGVSYYPLELGNFAVYRVEDIRYTLAAGPDTSRYFLREWVTDSFPGQGGETVYRLERFTRHTAEQAWLPDSVWTLRKDNRRLVVVENNVPYVRLVFPFRQGLSWDGHALNARPPQIYELSSTDTALSAQLQGPLDSLLSGPTLTVMQQISQDTLITAVRDYEVYADQVGLYYRQRLRLEYCADSPECIGLGIIQGGRSYRQTLIAYGKENIE